jgi:hypothetical protein
MQVRSEDITTIFDVCLERMRFGDGLEECLLDYPSEADELGPLLVAAQRARTLRPPALDPQARLAIQWRMHQAIADRQRAPRPTIASWFRPAIVRFALALLIAFVSMHSGVAAAQTSLPGNLLYPVKRAGEGIRLVLAFTPAQRAALHLDFAAARAAEIRALADGQQAIDSSLVADLEREYRLAREEFGRAPSADANNLAIRYVSERQSDVAMLSDLLARGNALGRPQLERALRLSEQALAGIQPAKVPGSQPLPTNGDNTGNTSEGKPDSAGPKATPEAKPAGPGPKATPEGEPDSTSPKATPKAKPDSAGPKATLEGKPADAGPKATPEDKPNDGGPKNTPEAKPDNTGPKATPEDKPDNADPKATPEGKPDNAGPKPTSEGKPDNASPKATPEGKSDNADPKPKTEDKPDNAGPKPKP